MNIIVISKEGTNDMPEPAYVVIARDYARQIRTGKLAAGTALPSYAELAQQHGVSDIVIRKALELLRSQGLVRGARGRGSFVTDRPNSVRVSPERQQEDPEETFSHEFGTDIHVERESDAAQADEELAQAFGITAGEQLNHVVTRATEGGRPISVSDTYHPLDVPDTANATVLEETVADRLPSESHAAWLNTPPGDLVKSVHQRFVDANGRVLMISDVSYPRDRYDSFVFRMTLDSDTRS